MKKQDRYASLPEADSKKKITFFLLERGVALPSAIPSGPDFDGVRVLQAELGLEDAYLSGYLDHMKSTQWMKWFSFLPSA